MISHLIPLPPGVVAFCFPFPCPYLKYLKIKLFLFSFFFFSECILMQWGRVFGEHKFFIWLRDLCIVSIYLPLQPFFIAPHLQICNLSAIIWLHYDCTQWLIWINNFVWYRLVKRSDCSWLCTVNIRLGWVWRANCCMPLHLLRNSFSMKRQSKAVFLGTICFLSAINMFWIVWLLWSVYHKLAFYVKPTFGTSCNSSFWNL